MVNMTATINLMTANPKKAGKSNIMDKATGDFQKLLSFMHETSEGDFNDIAPIEIQSILLQLIALNQSWQGNQIGNFHQNENQITPFEMNPDIKEQIQLVWSSLVKGNEQKDINQQMTKFYNELKQSTMHLSQSDLGDYVSELKQLLDCCSDTASTMEKNDAVDENNKLHVNNLERFIAHNTYINESLQKSNFREKIADIISEGGTIEESVEPRPKAIKSKWNPLLKDKINEGFALNEYPGGAKSTVDSEINLSTINTNQDPMHFQADMKTSEIESKKVLPFEKDNSLIQPREVLNQIIDNLETAVEGSEKQISVRLKPEYLGDMIIRIYTNQDEIRAQMFIENDFTRDIIQLNAAEIKNQVTQQGINLTEIEFYDMQDTGMTRDFSNGSYNGNSDHSRREQLFYKYETKELTSYSQSRTSNFLDLECNVNYVI